MNLSKKLKKIIYDLAPISVSDKIDYDEITSEISLINDLSFDSVKIMDMLLEIQKEFGDKYKGSLITPIEVVNIMNNKDDLKVKWLEQLIIKKINDNESEELK